MSFVYSLLIAIAFAAALSIILYYSKNEIERESEVAKDIVIRCVLPSVLLGTVVFAGALCLPWKNKFNFRVFSSGGKPTLNEGFYD